MKKIDPSLCTRRTVLLGMAGVAAGIAGCGGGGGAGIAGLSSGGTGSFTSGTITGLGSIIVNGIRYNDDTAAVTSWDDAGHSRTGLQLGMVVNIEGSAVTPAASATGLPTATAYRITYGSEWVGPVSNIGAATFDVLGHTVDVLATTLVEGVVQRYADLTTAHYVEIYGYVDQVDGHIQASRIEVANAQPAAYKLSGVISQINALNRTANLGKVAISWAAASVLPSDTRDGDFVRVLLQPTPVGTVWTAARIQRRSSPLTALSADQDYEAEVHGSITAYQSHASFVVNGIPVNAASARIVDVLAAGVQVEVEGRIRAGTLVATKVEVKTSAQIESQKFEFYGLISQVTAQSFELRGQIFDYDSNTQNRHLLTRTPLPSVEVKARRSNGRWYAIEIELED